MAVTNITSSFQKDGAYYVATVAVDDNFALTMYSDKPGTYTVKQQSDPNAPRPASTVVFSNRTEIDEQFPALVPVTLTLISDVPITYCSIVTKD